MSDYKIAVIGDIHSNYVGLERCIEHALKQDTDEFLFLGDYISYEIELMNGQSVEVNQYLKETAREYEAGDTVSLYPMESKINVYDIDGEEALVDEQKSS